MTNGDALLDFVGEKGRIFTAGEVLELPGGQQFRIFKFTTRKSDKRVFLHLQSKCRVCSEPTMGVYDVWRLRNGQRLTRMCPKHSGHVDREGTWLTSAEVALAADLRATENLGKLEEHAERRARAEEPGVAQKAVLKAVEDLDTLWPLLPFDRVVARAAGLLPRSSAVSDQRKGVARRALRSLIDKGVLPPGKFTGYRSHDQEHVVQVVLALDPKMDGMPLPDLVTLAAGVLPAPEPGARDMRRQVCTRAIEALTKGKEPLLALEGAWVVFHR